jgi:hypothetical protein
MIGIEGRFSRVYHRANQRLRKAWSGLLGLGAFGARSQSSERIEQRRDMGGRGGSTVLTVEVLPPICASKPIGPFRALASLLTRI